MLTVDADFGNEFADFEGLTSMPPPPRPLHNTPGVQSGINEDFMRSSRDDVKKLVQRISNILLDPYMSIYGTDSQEPMRNATPFMLSGLTPSA